MGGKGSGGHNKKSIEDHIRGGTYRAYRHGPLPEHIKRAAKDQVERAKIAAYLPPEKKPAKGRSKGGRVPRVRVVEEALPIPAWFDEHATAAFKRVCQILVDRGTLQDVNHATLEGYCSAYSKAVRADKILNEHGFTYEVDIFSKKGEVIGEMEKKRPEVDIAIRSWGQVKMFAVEMGITSSNGKAEGPPQSPLEKALDEALKKR